MVSEPAVVLALGVPGLYLLVRGTSVAVERFILVAEYYDVPDELIGLSILALGTSLPEVASHLIASLGIVSGTLAYDTTSAAVLGGNMGSTTTQLTLLFGVLILGVGRLHLSESFQRTSYVPMVLASALALALSFDGRFSRADGAVLLGIYLAYLYYSFDSRSRGDVLPETESANVARDVTVGVVALLAVLASAYVVLDAVVILVENLRLGGSMIGVVTIGVAAALPELSTVREAIRRDAPAIALGTLVGSGIVNVHLGIGLGAIISTYRVPASVVVWDLPFRIVVGVGLYVQLRRSDGWLSERTGLTLVALYVLFVGVHFLAFAGQ